MSLVVEGSGTQTATIGTEHTLHTDLDAGVFQLYVDTTNMVAGDVLELRGYKKVLSTGSYTLIYYGTFQHAQTPVVKHTPPFISMHDVKFTLKQLTGTGRAYDWEVVSYQKN